jgi:hypothetical protein
MIPEYFEEIKELPSEIIRATVAQLSISHGKRLKVDSTF